MSKRRHNRKQNRVRQEQGEPVLPLTTSFTDFSQTVTTTDTLTGIAAQNVSLIGKFAFFVENLGNNNANVYCELSPDNTHWFMVNGVQLETAAPNNNIILNNYYNQVWPMFAHYARITYQSSTAGNSTQLLIYYQAQS
ncbi:Hypothetical protein LUCI_5097 [Lucifera butyrica]|uniref:DUF6385 domain-containing protein n=1 Tax=Lucifera butyrica TaxID=1351585 RepID=A0A498REQ1_9FIRM|nr:DUF6385 domain-containing protein [Lucifera butyrica]VBB09799.1 Hypothetical protein LUCI_5097 [Lucifera butyrica]